MLKLKKPERYYVTAVIDSEGNAVKVVCDALEIVALGLDAAAPAPALNLMFARCNSETGQQEGPLIQYVIAGEELADMLERDGLSVSAVEGVIAAKEDYEYAESDNLGRIAKKAREAVKKQQEGIRAIPPIPRLPTQ